MLEVTYGAHEQIVKSSAEGLDHPDAVGGADAVPITPSSQVVSTLALQLHDLHQKEPWRCSEVLKCIQPRVRLEGSVRTAHVSTRVAVFLLALPVKT